MALRWLLYWIMQILSLGLAKGITKMSGGESKKGKGFNERFLK